MPEAAGYPVFRGLQKPLEFMGIRGRFIIFAAATAGCSILLYFILQLLCGAWIAIAISGAALATGVVTIFVKQKQGLHGKRKYAGIIIYRNIFRNHL